MNSDVSSNRSRQKVRCSMRLCSVENCGRKYVAKGYCTTHYQRQCKGQDMKQPILRVIPIEYCTLEGCNNKHIARGFCSYHYQRDRLGISLDHPYKERKTWRGKPVEHLSGAKRTKQYRDKLRQQILTAYGSKCTCCGSVQFLQVDHINGNGRQHRKELGGSGTQVYRYITKNNFPSEFQLLCKVCNYAKDTHIVCPILLHEEEGKVLEHQKFSLATF